MLPVLLHGDAAFAGQGMVAEVLNLSNLPGYRTGGTIHVVVNNQIGFTTPPSKGRSSVYSTDVAKINQVPIFHVNADDPEAAYRVLEIALDYRQEFHKDVVIDLIGFRRHGHNEGDEPTYTQPVMYRAIEAHPGVRALYARRLVRDGVLTEDAGPGARGAAARRVRGGPRRGQAGGARARGRRRPRLRPAAPSSRSRPACRARRSRASAASLTTVPPGFHLNPKMVQQLARRAKMAEGALPLDWGTAEALAFGSLLLEGTPIRISGQDSSRGTFSQRHALLHDTITGEAWVPLATLDPKQAPFEVCDSPLSEFAVLGFEYGYSVEWPRGARDVGGAVRRLRQRRPGHHRPVHRVGRGQVAADDAAGNAPAARLRGPGSRALERAHRALPAALRRRQHAVVNATTPGAVLPPAAAPDAPGRRAALRPVFAEEPASPARGGLARSRR